MSCVTTPPFRQQGVALVTALAIISLATVAVVAFSERHHMDIRRTDNLLQRDQAIAYARGGEYWAIGILLRDYQNDQNIDSLQDPWASPLPPTEVEGGTIAARIIDLQGRINLNNLSGPDQPEGGEFPEGGASVKDPAQQWLRNLSINVIGEDLGAAAVADWIDPDQQARFPDGAEDLTYLNLDPPYRTADTPITSTTELHWITGFAGKNLSELLPYLTALPQRTTININTAPAAVLQALAPQLDESLAKAVIERRDDEPFENSQTFIDYVNQQLGNTGGLDPTLQNYLGVNSRYFVVQVDVTMNRARVRLQSLLERDDEGKVHVLQRSLGEL